MGDSQPPSADVDLVGSYARRRGGDVEIVLADPKGNVADVSALTLHRSGRSVAAPAALGEVATGRALVATTPRSELRDGVWTIRLGTGADGQRLAARLLVQGERPLVLLWGADNPKTTLPKASLKGRQRAAAAAGRAVDVALAPLPSGPANRVRSAVRAAARRTLG